MRVEELRPQDVGRRVAWSESRHLERYGELRGYTRGGEAVVKLDHARKRPGQPVANVVCVPAAECRFVESRPAGVAAQTRGEGEQLCG